MISHMFTVRPCFVILIYVWLQWGWISEVIIKAIIYYSDIPLLVHSSMGSRRTSLKPFVMIHLSWQHPRAILSHLSDVCDLLYTILLHHKTGAIKCIFKVIIKTHHVYMAICYCAFYLPTQPISLPENNTQHPKHHHFKLQWQILPTSLLNASGQQCSTGLEVYPPQHLIW